MKRITATGVPRIGLIEFPGSNCDRDCADAFWRHFGIKLQPVWHTERVLPNLDAVLLPGGFSYGDYLRSGALAAHSPIMAAVKSFVASGGPALGICNGFQVLTESHLLPGALLRNQGRKFICKAVDLMAGSGESVYCRSLASRRLRVPIAHGEGRYHIDNDGLQRLRDNGQVAFRYVDQNGAATADANPNGALDNIAGIVSENGRVLGLMPHPERATDLLIGGSADGLAILESFLTSFM
ncbi:MAG: phosphoribosylformylglycinamidine synthase subunit PurQ [Deltaproteobacteria bacterium]|nr:phosphoribosylformylglycinamidine synthase subunit PurQ [Deltaproteobacteria bacterium]